MAGIKKIVAVVPTLHVLPSSPLEPDLYADMSLDSATPRIADMGWMISSEDDPGEILMSDVTDFISSALGDPKFGVLVEIAAAHMVAAKALNDPYFRMDRYKTRVDEWLSTIWELAQEIYEHNADQACLYHGARWPKRSAKGLEAFGRKWASGDKTRAQVDAADAEDGK